MQIKKGKEWISLRIETGINDGWLFIREDVGVEQAEKMLSGSPQGEAVTLPHTWNAKDGQDGGNDYYRGRCWYVRRITKQDCELESRTYLEFAGAAMTAEVFVDGKSVARHEGGFGGFRADITDVFTGENILAVSVDNSENDRVYPQRADFTFYGGLYRGVKLITVPEKHLFGKSGGAALIVKPMFAGTPDSVTVTEDGKVGYGMGADIKLKSDGSLAADMKIELKAFGNDGRIRFTIEGRESDGSVRSRQTESVIRDGIAEACITLEEAHLWNGLEDPYLYTARAELVDAEEVLDAQEVRFGCRSFHIDPEKGFFLNGRFYPLRGVSRHQDRADVGNALTSEMHAEDMEIIKELGTNSLRLAHYQHAQEFYDLCDENGILVWAEIPYITQHMENGYANTESQMEELVSQCINHPSIVCWGLSNEITASGTATAEVLENHQKLNELCHRLDATRPTTMAHVFMLETESPLTGLSDIGSYNLYFGWYLGELAQNDSFLDGYHSKYPNRCIGLAEYGADANPAFQTDSPERGDYSEQYQCVYHEHLLNCIEERPWLWSTYAWNLFDFGADGRNEGGRNGVNQKGLVTIDRKLKKDAFYLYKAAWSKTPFVHLCGKRYADRTEKETEIKVYSNCSEIVLYVDGEEQGRKKGDKIFTFLVPLTGEHVVIASAVWTDSADASDTMVIRLVSEPNPSYKMAGSQEIVNWFDKEEINPDYFSIRDTMGQIMQNPAGAAILNRMIAKAAATRGDVAKSTQGNENLQRMMAGMTVESLLKQAGDAIPKEQIMALNAALQKIKK